MKIVLINTPIVEKPSVYAFRYRRIPPDAFGDIQYS